MESVFAEARRLSGEGEPFILVTVVATKGSTPQKPGARLLVRGDGSIVGTLGGGCMEADVWEAARKILEKKGHPEVRRFVLTEDIAAKDGLVCGGTMDIFIDPVLEPSAMLPLVDEILAAYEGLGDRAFATRVSLERPDEVRACKLFIRDDGSTEGSLGSRALDDLARDAALELMPRGAERWLETEEGEGLYVETFTTPPTVVIVGGGHVGRAIYTVARFLGYRTVIIDDRERFASRERFPEADKLVVDAFDAGLRSLKLGPNHYVIVATRGHKLDDIALLEAARSRAGYVGLLGSKRKAVLIFRDLFEQGIPEERVRQLRAPVGLDLGGRQPEEIAVSILSEMQAARYGRSGAPLTMMDEKVLAKVRRLAARSGNVERHSREGSVPS